MNRDKGKARRDGRQLSTVNDIHVALRRLILNGAFTPGTVLSQIQLGRQLGVGRTPLREALRMLQQEGLIVAERHKRPRVVSFDPEVIEAVFAELMLLSALAAAISVPSLTAEDLAKLEHSLAHMRQASERKDVEVWEGAHTAFHRGMIACAGDPLLRRVDRLADDNRFYLRFLMTSEPVPWSAIDEDHGAMLDACRAGDWDLAAKASRASSGQRRAGVAGAGHAGARAAAGPCRDPHGSANAGVGDTQTTLGWSERCESESRIMTFAYVCSSAMVGHRDRAGWESLRKRLEAHGTIVHEK